MKFDLGILIVAVLLVNVDRTRDLYLNMYI